MTDRRRSTRTPALALAAAVALTLLIGCDSNADADDRDPPDADGLAYAESNQRAGATFSAIESALSAAPPISIVADVNHSQSAEDAGLNLRYTRVLLFGNPQLGTPLMQADQRAGLDLPQKMLVTRGSGGGVYASYNATDYLAARYDVEGAATLGQIGNALQMFAENATGGTVEIEDADDIEDGEGIVEVQSTYGIDETYDRLREAVMSAAPLTLVAELDHQANAAGVGLDLRPTRLLVFGNPQLGTPLMQDEQSIGIDLPQKMLVYEDAGGTVRIAYNDPFYLAERHDVDGQDDVLEQISGALGNLAASAAGVNR